jgi:TPP-dependent pyruvate/acetoin dehydrogenase alpha subunit
MVGQVSATLEGIPHEGLRWIYTTMMKIRAFEEECSTQFAANYIPGLHHTHLGEEAIDAGVLYNLRKDDYIVSTYRYCHSHSIARGGDLKRMMCEMYGKAHGYNKGKGGDMHVLSHELGLLVSSAIVGAGIPIALGGGLSIKMKGEDRVVACFFGDGASNQGTFHESLNLAALWKLPVIFVVDNNQYAASTPQTLHQTVKQVSARAVAYNMPGVTVEDGNDVFKVIKAARDAIENARKGGGPTLLEIVTFNLQQAKSYYPNEPILQEWKQKYGDPIERYRKCVLEAKVFSQSELDRIDREIRQEVSAASAFADQAPYPDLKELTTDIWYP